MHCSSSYSKCLLFAVCQMKKRQQRIEFILSSKKIEFEIVDVAASEDDKAKMREIIGDPKALPPQIFNGDMYCGVRICLLAS